MAATYPGKGLPHKYRSTVAFKVPANELQTVLFPSSGKTISEPPLLTNDVNAGSLISAGANRDSMLETKRTEQEDRRNERALVWVLSGHQRSAPKDMGGYSPTRPTQGSEATDTRAVLFGMSHFARIGHGVSSQTGQRQAAVRLGVVSTNTPSSCMSDRLLEHEPGPNMQQGSFRSSQQTYRQAV